MSNKLKHLAIIMDGNGRWATAQNKERSYGHYVGAQNMKDLAVKASKLDIEVLTLYAFSTENWSRSEKEVNFIMKLPQMFFDKYVSIMNENNIRVNFIGFLDQLPKATINIINKTMEKTKTNTGMVLNLAVNYGSQQEILNATINYTQEVIENKRKNDLTIDEFNDYLFTKDFPQVDYLIRTSGEYRLSNYLLWQISYAELYFTKTPFPIFTPDKLEEAVDEFYLRQRRFGG